MMKKLSVKKLLSVFLAALMLTGTPVIGLAGNVYAGESDVTVRSYEDQLEEISRKKEEALARIEDVRNSRNTEISEAQALDELIQLNIQQKNLVQTQLDAIGRQIEEKTARIAETEKKIEEQEQMFLARMTARYMEQEIDWIELILGSVSLVDFLTRLDSINAIVNRDREIMDRLVPPCSKKLLFLPMVSSPKIRWKT